MKSVWYESGMRNGLFYGTVPAVFMNNLYQFFLNLRDQCRVEVSPGYVCPEHERKFYFNARDRFGHWLGYKPLIYRNMFTFTSWQVPLGTPCTAALWNAPKPNFDKISFTESELLEEEEIYVHPVSLSPGSSGWENKSTVWERQRYRLVQKMRYCFVPLHVRINVVESGKEVWRNYYGNTGCIDQAYFAWGAHRQVEIRFSDYWAQESVDYKMGICAESLSTFNDVPVEGSGWVKQKIFTTARAPSGGSWQGVSALKVYGVVDLATHPDFSKYFDIQTPNEKEEI